MKRTYLVAIFLIALVNLLLAQQNREPGRFLPTPTLQGAGKIDTRIDNMGYWRSMADSGYVLVAPPDNVPAATFTGSRIEDPMVLTSNSTDVAVTNVNSTQSENSIFVSPMDDSLVLNSNNSTQNPVGSLYGADYLISSSGGNTWGGSIGGAGGSNSGDPAATISLTGRMYIGFINSASGQSVSYSADGGTTWTPVVCGSYAGGMLDKNHLWIDNSPTSPHEGNVYSAWTNFGAPNTNQIMVTRSVNDGVSYSTPVNVSQAVNAGSHNQGVNIQTGPNGEVYVAWSIYDGWPTDETAIGFAKSTNGGASYATATRIISNIRGIRTSTTSKNHRVNSFPSMTVDISGGSNNGYLYIVWANIGVPGVNSGDDIDVYVIRSTNGGTTWSSPIKVNQDPGGLGKEHYFPWITCDPVTGNLSVVFFDDRNVTSSQCEVFCANSFDGGLTWSDFKVSDVAFTPAPIPGLAGGYMGDYLGISSRNNKVYPVWPDNRTGTIMTYCSPYELSALPDADFIVSNTTPCLSNTVQFTDKTNKNPVSWSWTITPSTHTYMNGTSAISRHPQVRFNAYGNYTVQLIVTNAIGSDTLVRSNYIGVNYANADFIASNLSPIINTPVIFTDQSSCNISSYSWNFGAGATPATANTQGPHTVVYSTTGYKTVSLTVNGNVTKTRTNYIEALPEIYNMYNGSLTVCAGTFYDPQGTSNYGNNQNITMTFYPGDTSKSVQMAFSQFRLEYHPTCEYDYLNIYDGPSTAYPLMGIYCDEHSPGTVVSTHSSGALTFKFHSDVSVGDIGWQATVSCVNSPPPVLPYCYAGTSACEEYISSVVIGSINNPSGCITGGYTHYSSITTKVSPGISYPITVTNGAPQWDSDQCRIWVDWNHDYDFSDAGETISVSGSPGVGPYTANIIPPANAVKGLTRLRIRVLSNGAVNPCGLTFSGEVEDYALYVGTPGLWSGGGGGSGTDWNNAANWDDGRIPLPALDVVIPEGAPSYPVVSGSTSCSDLEIKDGGLIGVATGSTLNISGNLTVGEGANGTLSINGGVCNIAGSISVQSGGSIEITNGGVLNDND